MAIAKNPPKRSVVIAARVITAVVSIAGAEGVLWFAGYPYWWGMDPNFGSARAEYECDPDLGWRPREGAFNLVFQPTTADPTAQTFKYTNWSGGRRATAADQPATGTSASRQVLFFGDSYIQGYGLSDSESLPWIVQERHPELQVSNYGSGLYGTYQSYLAMKKWVHGPSAVYYLLNGFHEGRNAGDPSFLRIMKKSPPGCFYPYAQLSRGEIQGGRSQGDVVWPLSRHFRTVALVQEYTQIFESYRRVQSKRRITQKLLSAMKQLVSAEGGTFTVILFDLDPEDRPDYRRFLESQQIAFVDCDRAELHDRSLRQPDGHPTKALNQLLATWIEPVGADSVQVISVKHPVRAGKTQ